MEKWQETKKQHYVPSCYLANFGIDGNKGRNSTIYFQMFSNSSPLMRPRVSSIDKFPVENNFYDIPELGEKKKIIEDFFAKLEGEYAALLKKTIEYVNKRGNNISVLTHEDKKSLVGQFAMQIVRTPFQRNYYEHIYQTIANELPCKNFPKLNKEDFSQIHIRELLSFKMANFYVNLLNDRNWVFLVNHTEQPFFTSDNPAIFINYSSNQSEALSPASDQMTFFIPLSPTVAVELYSKNLVTKSEMFFDIWKNQNIQWYNMNLKENCTRFMISNQSDFSYIKGSDERYE